MNLSERHKEEKDILVLSPQHLNNILLLIQLSISKIKNDIKMHTILTTVSLYKNHFYVKNMKAADCIYCTPGLAY